MNNRDFLSDDQVDELNRIINLRYGYNFSDYSFESFKRRASRFILLNQLNFEELTQRLVEDEDFFGHFLNEITVNVTDVFRDPWFFKALRKEVIPNLHSYPVLRIWHAGCASGEEVYSLAILLHEAGLLDRSILYATDLNTKVLEKGKKGMYDRDQADFYEQFYLEAGGTGSFKDYYFTHANNLVFKDFLKKKIVFAQHNLITDHSFNEFNIILCRNVLIYFNKTLQNKVLKLLFESLTPLGFLALGEKETLDYSIVAPYFETVDRKARIYRKK